MEDELEILDEPASSKSGPIEGLINNILMQMRKVKMHKQTERERERKGGEEGIFVLLIFIG